MKRVPFTYGIDRSGKKYWRSVNELAESKEFREALAREFPEGAAELSDGLSRRSFLQLMGASVGLAGLAACRRPEEKILPFSRASEAIVPGKPLFYATAMAFGPTALGLLVETHEGRPTKIEGNPRHPESRGGLHAFAQASILDLYDPDRSRQPRQGEALRSWDEVAAFLQARGELHRASRGQGLAIVTEAHRSPTLQAQLERLKKELPEVRIVRWDPLHSDGVREGARLAFGRPLETTLHLDQARVIASFGADLLATEGSPVRQAREFAGGRKVEKPGDTMNRLYVAESVYSLTGANADHRLRVSSGMLPELVLDLARELAEQGLAVPSEVVARARAVKLFEGQAKWVRALARDLRRAQGAGLVVAGAALPAPVHALVHLLNEALGNVGRGVRHVRAFDPGPEGPAELTALAASMTRGEVQTLLVLGANPVFDAPADARFAEAMGKVEASLHLGTHLDETGAQASWHLNRAHYLESWGDVRAQDGTASVIQPLIAPLFGGRTDAEVVALLLGRPAKAHDLVRETWREGAAAELEWRRALHEGMWEGSAWPHEKVAVRTDAVGSALAALPAPRAELEVTFHPDCHAWDGRYANNGWLQELPDPLSKLTWDNAALVAPATAARLGLTDGALVEIAAGGRKVVLPALLAPGQADDSIALALGPGRRVVGRVGQGVGFDVYPLRTSERAWRQEAVSVRATGALHPLARTQEHNAMEGRPLVREGTLSQFETDPAFAKKMVEHPPLVSLFPDQKYDGHRWGMVIDLNACTGCNACTIACQAENNIPLVGKEGVLRSREMHWIRVDRYFEGEQSAEPSAVFQPIGCAHCENAPCEQVCPVGATTHSPEGLNDMAYNRCVGTRYCANNCPFKVRRFNFFNYQKDLPELRKMQHNPDVTVRARGVMEKCTFCVQRIEQAKIGAHVEGRDRVADGEVRTACQQTCPTGAIHFGDLNDAKSGVAKLSAQSRSYRLLEELNIRPRTTFLAKVRNPNPDLEGA